MVEVADTDVVFSFPDVDEEAILVVHFCGADLVKERLRIQGAAGEGIRLATIGRFVMRLQPNVVSRDRLYRPEVGYPFAILVSTPPQGGIDGYFLDGLVYPLRTAADAHANQSPASRPAAAAARPPQGARKTIANRLSKESVMMSSIHRYAIHVRPTRTCYLPTNGARALIDPIFLPKP